MALFPGPDSPAYRAWSAAADVVILNVLTLAGCLPVVTAGASLTACARVAGEMAVDGDPAVVTTWWRSFRLNLSQSLTWWLPVLVLVHGRDRGPGGRPGLQARQIDHAGVVQRVVVLGQAGALKQGFRSQVAARVVCRSVARTTGGSRSDTGAWAPGSRPPAAHGRRCPDRSAGW